MTKWHEIKLGITAVLVACSMLVALPSGAEEIVASAASDANVNAEASPRPLARRLVQADFGLRKTFVKDGGYDTYSTNDVLTQGSLGASVTLLTRGRASLAVGGRWDFGGSSASIRGAETSIYLHRLEAVIEPRWHVRPWLYAFLRLAPGAVHASSRLTDASAPSALTETRWLFAADASLGGAVQLTGPQSDGGYTPRLWLLADVGYTWSPRFTSTLSPSSSEDDPRLYGDFTARSLALRGGFGRLSLAMSF